MALNVTQNQWQVEVMLAVTVTLLMHTTTASADTTTMDNRRQ